MRNKRIRTPGATRVLKVLELSGHAHLFKIIRETRDSLLASCPQPPTPSMVMLCERAGILAAHLALADKAFLHGEGQAGRHYIAMSNTYQRVLRQLSGLRSTRAPAHAGDGLVAQLAAAAGRAA